MHRAVLDTCVLVPGRQRDFLLQLAAEEAYAPPWGSGILADRWVLDWNDRRLAVLDHDIEAIIHTHAKDRKVAAWLLGTAAAFEEIAEIDLSCPSHCRAPPAPRPQAHGAHDPLVGRRLSSPSAARQQRGLWWVPRQRDTPGTQVAMHRRESGAE